MSDETHDDWPEIAEWFAGLCKGDIDRLVSPYFEQQGRTGAETFGAILSGIANPLPAKPDPKLRAQAEDAKRRAVAKLAEEIGELYEYLVQIGDPAAFFDAIAKLAQTRRPRRGRRPGMTKRWDDIELLAEYDRGDTKYAIAKRRAGSSQSEHDRIEARLTALLKDRRKQPY